MTSIKKSILTEQQVELIEYLISKGFGWAKFAKNIEKQGWCSEKQHATLYGMNLRVRAQAAVANQPQTSSRSRWTQNDGHWDIDEAFDNYGGEEF